MFIFTFWICVANSLVGERHKTWVSRTVVSIDWSKAMEKVAVFPVPDWAWAITSRLFTMGLMALCWIAEGFSNPKKVRIDRDKHKDLKVSYKISSIFDKCTISWTWYANKNGRSKNKLEKQSTWYKLRRNVNISKRFNSLN